MTLFKYSVFYIPIATVDTPVAAKDIENIKNTGFTPVVIKDTNTGFYLIFGVSQLHGLA